MMVMISLLHMGCLNVPPVDLSGSHSTIVRSLRSREAILRPTEWMLVIIEQRILLLDPKPGLLILCLLHQLETDLPLVSLHGLVFEVVGVAQDEDVVTLSKWTGIHLDWLKVDIAVITSRLRTKHISEINETHHFLKSRLIAGTSVVVPHGQVLHLGRLGVEALDLGPHALPGAVNPDVGGAHPGALGQAEVLLQHHLIGVTWLLNTGHFGLWLLLQLH